MSENNKSTGRSPSEGGKNTQNISKRYDIPQRPMTDPSFGLSAGQVAERIELGEVNTPVKSPVKTVKQIIIGNTCTYFNFNYSGRSYCMPFFQSSYVPSDNCGQYRNRNCAGAEK